MTARVIKYEGESIRLISFSGRLENFSDTLLGEVTVRFCSFRTFVHRSPQLSLQTMHLVR